MSEDQSGFTGGCLCGALRYAATGPIQFMGYCCCADCRKASGSGYIGFIGMTAEAVSFTGPSVEFRSPAAAGGDAVRTSCAHCHSLVFGGERGRSASFTLYAGSLDDASVFRPAMVIFERDRPDWVRLPPGLAVFETMPD